MESVRLDHLNLSVRDFTESVEWYRRIFGFETVESGIYDDEPWGVLRSGDVMLCIYEEKERLELEKNSDADRFHRVYHFGFRLTDTAAFAKRIEAHQIPTYFDSPVRYPHSRSWYVKDPTGHMIEVAFWDHDRVRF